MFCLNCHSRTKTRLRLVTVSLFPFSLCVCVHLMREIPFVLFHFQILVFLQTTVISSFLLIISVYFSCYILPLCFKFSSLYFLFLLLQTFFFTHSSSLCFSVWPNICLSLSPFNNFPSPTWVSLSFSFPFTPSLSALLCIPSVSRYSGWLSFHPIAYRHDLGFISMCMSVCECMCGWACVCVLSSNKA